MLFAQPCSKVTVRRTLIEAERSLASVYTEVGKTKEDYH
jgi:hypothetical protein